MKVTNRLSLPEAMVQAALPKESNPLDRVSVTELLKSTRELVLEKKNWEHLTDDVAERVWAIFGTAVHAVLATPTETTFTEEYLSTVIDGITVTGRFDAYDMASQKIIDYKVVSRWKVQFGDYSDWEKQGKMYAWLLRLHGLECDACEFVALIRDWSATEAKRSGEYPQSPVFTYRFSVKDADIAETERFVRNRIKAFQDALESGELTPCTDEERWATPTKYAVMKKGRKSAVRLLDTHEEADDMVENLGSGLHFVEVRYGEDKKCEHYCLCAQFCDRRRKKDG